jgi:leucyl aminopeptidase
VTNFKSLLTPDRGEPARSITLVDTKSFEAWFADQPTAIRALATAAKFKGAADSLLILPTGDANWSVTAGVASTEGITPWCLARAAEILPEGAYRIIGSSPGTAALGWLLAQYRFDRYKPDDKPVGPRVLLSDAPAQIDATVREAEAVALVRDLVNTPAADMGPADLEAAAARIAKANAPRLIEIEWGNPKNPRIAIIGKGVCFDSGGLDIKPSSGMRLMKKDMGGAAHALALAQLIMQARLPVRLHMLVPAVENAIAGNAFRPGDILTSRKGLTVEITNTDAEGRLVLADALTRAAEDTPVQIIDFATLTGAARVALGPDLPATFANDDALADDVLAAGIAQGDPLWRMPLHAGYDDMLKSDIADLNNSPDGGFAGSVTAALFLQKFVPDGTPWLHLDTFAWRPAAKPGRPKGGEALGLRAIWTHLRTRFV